MSRESPASHQPLADRRHHGIDVLRAAMIIVVVIAHVALAYETTPEAHELDSAAAIGERFRDPDRTMVADRLHKVARGSVNPMLFLLAGFSWAVMLQRRSLKSVMWSRTTRIVVPLVAGWFLVFPLIRYAFALGRRVMLATDGQASIAVAFAETSFTACLPFADDTLYLAHFWFLYYLVLFYLASMALVVLAERLSEPLRERIRSLQASILVGDLRWLRLPLLVMLSVLATLPDRTPELEISQRFRPDPETFLAHYVFFLVGWLFALHREILGELDRRAGLRFLFGLFLSTLVVVPLGVQHESAPDAGALRLGPIPLQLGVYWLLHALATWMMVLGMLGLAERWFTRSDRRLAFVVESSFWIYIAHVPVAVFIPILLHDWSLDADVKMWISSAIVLAICFASHHFLVRNRVIGRWLRGRYRRSDRPGSSGASSPSTS